MDNQLQGVTVFLVGMMGSGKSTVGQVLAEQLGYRFYDADVVVERVAECSITELFATQGEAAFRALETQVLSQLAAQVRSVIATGGGVILRSENWSYLRHGIVIWLDAPIPLLVERLATDESRPLLQNTDLNQKLTTLLQERRAYYEQADLTITLSADQSPEAVTEQILQTLPKILRPKNQNGANA